MKSVALKGYFSPKKVVFFIQTSFLLVYTRICRMLFFFQFSILDTVLELYKHMDEEVSLWKFWRKCIYFQVKCLFLSEKLCLDSFVTNKSRHNLQKRIFRQNYLLERPFERKISFMGEETVLPAQIVVSPWKMAAKLAGVSIHFKVVYLKRHMMETN